MRLTKFGHSCLLVEEGGARVLLDPGSFSDRRAAVPPRGLPDHAGRAGGGAGRAGRGAVAEARRRGRLPPQGRPRVAVPVHEKVLSEVGIGSHYRQLEQLRGPGTAFRVLDDGRSVEL
jgi:Beta-lactamase superfamily domain